MTTKDKKLKEWSDHVSGIAVDALVDAGLVARKDFDAASTIVAEEVFIRLIIGDKPASPTLLTDLKE
jgi:hypothetical protein